MEKNKKNNGGVKNLHNEIMDLIESADLQTYVVTGVLDAVKSDVISQGSEEEGP